MRRAFQARGVAFVQLEFHFKLYMGIPLVNTCLVVQMPVRVDTVGVRVRKAGSDVRWELM